MERETWFCSSGSGYYFLSLREKSSPILLSLLEHLSILIDSVEDDNEHARIFTGFTSFVCAASGGTGS